MREIILAPDSFKGTLSAQEICALEKAAVLARFPGAAVHTIPMADGGEGMVESYLNLLGGERITVSVTGPKGTPVPAVYGILPDGSAVMEMAAAAGLPLMGEERDPLHATSRGVGELLLDAEKRGIRKVLLGLGGSATNDCGIGMAAALGFRFLDSAGSEVEPLAENLERIAELREPDRLPELTIRAACDVNNPLLGRTGATYTFGPQKGADEAMLVRLEAGMASFAAVLERHYGSSPADHPGAGAAGGLGAAVLQLLRGTLQPGIELLLDAAHFDQLLESADMVFTGEGRIDWQSAHGKVPAGVGARCKRRGVPCVALCGSIGKGAEELYGCGITAIFSAVKGPAAFEEIRATCREDLTFLTDSVLRLLG